MWRVLSSVVFLLGIAAIAFACEAVTHANDFSTGSAVQTCGANALFCNGACIGESQQNCGSCGATCEPTQVCSDGKCGSECTGGTKLCGTLCVDTNNDPDNCGSCGGRGDSGVCPVCQDGQCHANCLGTAILCGKKCVDPITDPKNCGGCNKVCGVDAPFCLGGNCGISCGAETTCPDGTCADIFTDPKNCGVCFKNCDQPAEGTGTAYCADKSCGIACNEGLTLCTDDTVGGTIVVCADITSDVNNCGGCNRKCPTGGNPEVCHQGLCVSG